MFSHLANQGKEPPTRPARRSSVVDVVDASPASHSQTSADAPEDLLQLEDFNDEELLRSLWNRYERKEIYTWVGNVLVSVNPYRDVGAFKQEKMAQYLSSRIPKAPHLFATVRAALAAPGNRHAILITGESGAGKTEATRAVLSFLAMRQDASHAEVRDRLLQSTPVLEAFGNASTRQNANSSRFGKFIEVYLNAQNEVLGATLQPYMLEASRVSGSLPTGEHTYHIFYLLRAALSTLLEGSSGTPFFQQLAKRPEWAQIAAIAGGPLAASKRLSAGPPLAWCAERFKELHDGLLASGIEAGQVAACSRVVAAVGLLAEGDASDETLSNAAKLLEVPEVELKTFLQKAELSVGVGGTGRTERVCRARTGRESATLRASVAQELYAALFTWLTRLVAKGIRPDLGGEDASPTQQGGDSPAVAAGGRRLGLLDLYGFEVFVSNGFEQFLINYCNERLQQFFNRQVFTREAEEYAAEGLDSEGVWRNLMAACQLPALSLLEGDLSRRSVGVFGIIDDRSRCAFEESQTSSQLAEAISMNCGAHAAFRRAPRNPSRIFGVAHFAGEVFYEAEQFVQKNASAHRPDIVAFLSKNGGNFVKEVLAGDSAAGGLETVPSPAATGGQRGRRKLFGRTLISVFQQELQELCTSLEARQCRHVRCLRPNDDQAPLVFDDASMLRQCRYSGLMEATRIRRQGYAHRRPLFSFASRYSVVLGTKTARSFSKVAREGADDPARAAALAKPFCDEICKKIRGAGIEALDARIGLTKVFLREASMQWLEAERSRVAATSIGAVVRGTCTRRRFRRAQHAVRFLQRVSRGMLGRRDAAALRQERAEIAAREAWRRQCAAHYIWCVWRMRKQMWEEKERARAKREAERQARERRRQEEEQRARAEAEKARLARERKLAEMAQQEQERVTRLQWEMDEHQRAVLEEQEADDRQLEAAAVAVAESVQHALTPRADEFAARERQQRQQASPDVGPRLAWPGGLRQETRAADDDRTPTKAPKESPTSSEARKGKSSKKTASSKSSSSSSSTAAAMRAAAKQQHQSVFQTRHTVGPTTTTSWKRGAMQRNPANPGTFSFNPLPLEGVMECQLQPEALMRRSWSARSWIPQSTASVPVPPPSVSIPCQPSLRSRSPMRGAMTAPRSLSTRGAPVSHSVGRVTKVTITTSTLTPRCTSQSRCGSPMGYQGSRTPSCSSALPAWSYRATPPGSLQPPVVATPVQVHPSYTAVATAPALMAAPVPTTVVEGLPPPPCTSVVCTPMKLPPTLQPSYDVVVKGVATPARCAQRSPSEVRHKSPGPMASVTSVAMPAWRALELPEAHSVPTPPRTTYQVYQPPAQVLSASASRIPGTAPALGLGASSPSLPSTVPKWAAPSFSVVPPVRTHVISQSVASTPPMPPPGREVRGASSRCCSPSNVRFQTTSVQVTAPMAGLHDSRSEGAGMHA
eukprot:TRINITY_DN5796_c0_g1_i2.p1 TRINITY_DN5796_c0_g1~~TRINITY_DN5796_c0_g1_i2.p1  ORF type:complete len:1442 (-),score=353.43 TRINITY_DN5796_c0_g1_i2:80-4405(-)